MLNSHLTLWTKDHNRIYPKPKTIESSGEQNPNYVAFAMGKLENNTKGSQLKLIQHFNFSSICEACVWGDADQSLCSRRLICEQVVRHLLTHHFQFDDDQVRYTASELDVTFALDRSFEEFFGGAANAEQLTIGVIKGFDQLAKCLRSLDELPLVITSVLGKSAAFRYCELQPIVANARTYKKDGREHFNGHVVNEAVIQFGNSNHLLFKLVPPR